MDSYAKIHQKIAFRMMTVDEAAKQVRKMNEPAAIRVILDYN